MQRLSSLLGTIRPYYDVVVIGSGYGGAIPAALLARYDRRGNELQDDADSRRLSVCVLERGREWGSGEFPRTLPRAVREFQVHLRGRSVGTASGLYDIRLGPHMGVVQGCGLGGTSLINAGVVLEPTPSVFDDPRWPCRLRSPEPWRKYFTRVKEGLGAEPYPASPVANGGVDARDSWPQLEKLDALCAVAGALDGPASRVVRPPLAVSFNTGSDARGARRQCSLCGDCVSGCNYSAKNTLPATYLADAFARGAELFCQVEARRIERLAQDTDGRPGPARWRVWYRPVGMGRARYGRHDMFVTAHVVILAAGSLGSTEILLRSQRHGLPLSKELGQGFTGNGDAIAFAYNGDRRVEAVGFGKSAAEGLPPAGPVISGMIDLRHREPPVLLQDGSLPGPLAPLAIWALPFWSRIAGRDTDVGFRDRLRELGRELAMLLLGRRRGALRNTLTFLVMSRDDLPGQGEDPWKAGGRLRLVRDKIQVWWEGAGGRTVFRTIDRTLRSATAALGGTHVANPMWSRALGRKLVTVHPLGGARMADSSARGVVDPVGNVFVGRADDGADEGDDATHPGLFVADGAVIPCSLGANPLLTIAAQACRTADHIASSRTTGIDFDRLRGAGGRQQPPLPRPRRTSRPGLRFTERMRGSVRELGRNGPRGPISVTLTVQSDDLHEMVRDGSHAARVFGTASCPEHSPTPMTVYGGTFNLFARDEDRAEARQMRYRFFCVDTEGRRYYVRGAKRIYHRPGFGAVWRAVSRLPIEIFQVPPGGSGGGSARSGAVGHHPPPGAPLVAEGTLRIGWRDVRRLLMSVRVTNEPSVTKRWAGLVRFGLFYLATLFRQFAWFVIRPADVVSPFDLPRTHSSRTKGAPQPVARYKEITPDGADIYLTRYRRARGGKGPVIVAPGFGMSTYAFVAPTVEKSITEYLVENDYDVWLFDYRASELSAASGTPFTMDDIARYDYPLAVDTVRRVRKREGEAHTDVQIIGHCVGSGTLLMSILGGHLETGVRSVICSQMLTHVDQPVMNRVKARLRVADLARALGAGHTTNPDFDARSPLMHRVWDWLLRFYPSSERCRNPVCRRILFLYGEVVRHGELNAPTHDAMYDMFNRANLETFQHLSHVIRQGRLVDGAGRNRYLGISKEEAKKRLRLPITLMQGERNGIFLPSGLGRSLRWLVRTGKASGLEEKVKKQGLDLEDARGEGTGLYSTLWIADPTSAALPPDRGDRYGHLDCFVGRNAARDVFPKLLAELRRGDRVARTLSP